MKEPVLNVGYDQRYIRVWEELLFLRVELSSVGGKCHFNFKLNCGWAIQEFMAWTNAGRGCSHLYLTNGFYTDFSYYEKKEIDSYFLSLMLPIPFVELKNLGEKNGNVSNGITRDDK